MKPNKTILIVVVVVLIVGAAFAYAYYTGKTGQRMVADNTNQSLINSQENAQAALTKILAAEHKQPVIETHVTLIKLQNNFVSGNIFFGSTTGEGGAFLARFIKGKWVIDYEGNGSIDCVKIKALGYPQDVLTGFCDVACTMEAKLCPDGSAVGRTGPNCEFALCPGENSGPRL